MAEGLTFASGMIFEGVAQNENAVVHFKSGSKICVLSYGVGSDGSCDKSTNASRINIVVDWIEVGVDYVKNI